MEEAEWVIIDTETSGFERPIRVFELAAQRMRGKECFGNPFRVFLNHNVAVSSFASAIHGYTEEFLSREGISPMLAHEQFRAYVENRPVVSHFMTYDWSSALLPEWNRLGIPHIGKRGFCAWSLARRSIPELSSHSLRSLRDAFEMTNEGAHSASADVAAVREIFQHVIFPRLAQVGIDTFQKVADFSSTTPILKCHCLIDGRDFEEEQQRIRDTRKEKKERDRAVQMIRTGQIGSLPAFTRDYGFVAEEPLIDFNHKTFLFTGKMVWGSRSEVIPIIERLGAVVSTSKKVSRSVDYLILGEDKEAGWTALLHGGKLGDALCKKIAEPESRLQIVLESDFFLALTTHMVRNRESGTGGEAS
jgi:DNA polymerase III epsilon subunit-like protein